jgi:hypothetical protein
LILMHEQAEAMTGTPVQTPTAAVTMLAHEQAEPATGTRAQTPTAVVPATLGAAAVTMPAVEEEVRVATRRAACEY